MELIIVCSLLPTSSNPDATKGRLELARGSRNVALSSIAGPSYEAFLPASLRLALSAQRTPRSVAYGAQPNLRSNEHTESARPLSLYGNPRTHSHHALSNVVPT